jgi:hypothetical protein
MQQHAEDAQIRAPPTNLFWLGIFSIYFSWKKIRWMLHLIDG